MSTGCRERGRERDAKLPTLPAPFLGWRSGEEGGGERGQETSGERLGSLIASFYAAMDTGMKGKDKARAHAPTRRHTDAVMFRIHMLALLLLPLWPTFLLRFHALRVMRLCLYLPRLVKPRRVLSFSGAHPLHLAPFCISARAHTHIRTCATSLTATACAGLLRCASHFFLPTLSHLHTCVTIADSCARLR